ncbi:glycosyltransferase [Sphingobacterium cellulitidis]|uniref:glycosyltransferase n=1 Tax=Sphingobacterium cellulitidis TaxID=1768011 RepID=UPI0015C5B4C8|nr:glycosyltransferase [Sphingobacterium cellulitidis]
MSIFSYLIGKRPSITYAITVCNERLEIKKLLDFLIPRIRQKDEIVVLQDVTKRDEGVSEILSNCGNKIIKAESNLNGDFATFKNQLITLAKCEYLFQIDADEMLPDSLVEKLPGYLALKSKYDCFNVPRINTVEGITEEHLKKWNWKLNEDGYINYPDWQARIIKLKTDYPIKWRNKVHEVLTGYKKMGRLKGKGYEFAIIHKKEINKQEQQNAYYDKIF